MRESAGLNLDDAAARLDKKRSALHRIETGVTKADVHFVRSAMDLYDAYDPNLLDQTREAAKPLWFRAYGVADAGYVDVETFAVAVKEFPGLNLPGLLQTETYIRALFSSGRRRRTRAELENDVQVRRIRQERLLSEDSPLHLTAIVDEAVLRREVGGPEVMLEQLGFLIESAAFATVTLQAVPLADGAHSAMDGAFILLDFPDPDDAQMLYVEYTTGALHIEDEREVSAAKMKFEQLRSEALSPSDSIYLLERMIGELRE